MMMYCNWCSQDVDLDDMGEVIYISDIFDGQPLLANVVITLSCPDCLRTLLSGNDEVELYG